MKFPAFLIIAALLCAAPRPAHAMRCGERLVYIGDTKAEVLAKCGEPFSADTVAVETVRVDGDRSFDLPVEEWVYNQGPDTFLKILIFKGGRLEKIEDGDRVEGKQGREDLRRGLAVPPREQQEMRGGSVRALSASA
jgi:hypothetical protein